MVALRNGPRGAELASLGLAPVIFLLTPTSIGRQDLAALLAQQPHVTARWHQHIASPFGTIHAATFNLPQPIGTTIPEPPLVRLASIGSNEDIVGSITINPPMVRRGGRPQIVFPVINRAGKGDRLVPATPSAEEPVATPAADSEPLLDELPDVQADIVAVIRREQNPPPAAAVKHDEVEAAMRFAPFPEYDISLSLELHPKLVLEEPGEVADVDPAELYPSAPPRLDGLNTEVKAARLYFGNDLFGIALGAIMPWSSGEEPILMLPPGADPDMKRTALAPAGEPGLTVANKGEVTGEDQRPKSPSERLGLTGPKRAKAEKCLANAVYFESRGEPVRGQIAVAQVVMNRTFSGFYPNDVCGVVYQNAHRHLACQFTFACDGIPDVVNDQEAWTRAKRIAKETLDGKLWLHEIGKSTHYHAYWVHPWWVRTMRKLTRIGVHTFYRPRRWGDGADAPSWGSETYTADAATKM